MSTRILTPQRLQAFRHALVREEKSTATVEKYLRDARAFLAYAGPAPITKDLVLAYKQHLQGRGYAPRSINSMLAALNRLWAHLGWADCRVKFLRLQRQLYTPEEKQLTRAEYLRLVDAAHVDPQLQLVLKTICATGIRVSELRFFTVQSVHRGAVSVRSKAKTRTVLIPARLRTLLLAFARRRGIAAGPIFCTPHGRPLSRTAIWAKMKALCRAARVAPAKVFPHNLRKLFARTFYAAQKDIAKLADLLGHSSIDTTRIYIISTGSEHRRQLESLGLLP